MPQFEALSQHKPVMNLVKQHLGNVAKHSTYAYGELDIIKNYKSDLLPSDSIQIEKDIDELMELLASTRLVMERVMKAAKKEKEADTPLLDDLDEPDSDPIESEHE